MFAKFWREYPRHERRKDAERAFSAIGVDAALLQQMMTTLAWQRRSRSWLDDEGAFIPLASTWLRSERWNDEQPAALADGWLFDCPHLPKCRSPIDCVRKRRAAP